MKISTRGRYALRVMIDLADNLSANYIPLKDVATRQNISQKYLESIMTDLSKAGLVEGQHGKGGGYRLNRDPSEYTVGEILRVCEGDLAPVSCLEDGAKPCEMAGECRTLSMWKSFYEMINEFFDGRTLADFINRDAGDDYII